MRFILAILLLLPVAGLADRVDIWESRVSEDGKWAAVSHCRDCEEDWEIDLRCDIPADAAHVTISDAPVGKPKVGAMVELDFSVGDWTKRQAGTVTGYQELNGAYLFEFDLPFADPLFERMITGDDLTVASLDATLRYRDSRISLKGSAKPLRAFRGACGSSVTKRAPVR